MKRAFFFLLTVISIPAFSQVSIDIPPLSSKADFIRNYPVTTQRVYAPDMAQVASEDDQAESEGKPPRYAVHLPVNVSTENGGYWMELKGGARVWRARFETNGALATTLLFNEFSIPEGGLVHIYNDDRSQVLGAFTSQNNQDGGNYASQILHGSACTIEYYEPAAVRGQGNIEIAKLGYCYRYVYGPYTNSRGGGSDPCQVDVNCSPEGNDWQDEKRGVVRIGLVFPFSSSWCSGSMVNNTAQDCAPYLLTALHCTESSSASNFGQYTFYYNYESSGCAGGSVSNNQTTVGCVELANSADGGGNSGSDFSLLEVTGSIPSSYNIYYNGWNAQNVASPSGVSIHHPSADRKKISTYTSSLQSTQWGSASGSHWRVFWSQTANGHGVTEGGSSGSPIFDNQKRIVGTLTGGSSFCTSPNSPDQYGKMSYHWASNPGDDLRDWLDPINTGQLTLGGTYAPCTPPNTNDAGIADVISPAGSICDNSITPVITLTNFGGIDLTTVTINYNVDGNGNQQFTWTGNLSTNQSETVTLPTLSIGAGPHTFNVSTSSPNGQVDDNGANDAVASAFSITIADSYVTLILNLDDYADETTWDLVEDGGGVIASGGPYDNFENTQVEEEICVATGECYTFTIYDDFGDGICCYTGTQNPNYQDGSYSLGDANGISINTGSEFEFDESVNFCVPASSAQCDTLSDPFFARSSGFALYPNGDGGYIAGSNSFGDLAKAQSFAAPQQPSEITGIIYWSAGKIDDGGSVTANLYALDGSGSDLSGQVNSAPGTVLSTQVQALQRVDTAGFLNRIEFSSPQIVSGPFAVGLDFTGFSGSDELGIVTNLDGDANGADLAWERWSDGDWYSMNSAWNSQNDGDFDLGIFPILCPQTVTGLDDGKLSFNLYPNPNDGRFVLVNANRIDAVMTIYNAMGQEVLIENLTGSDVIPLDVSNQDAGIYFLKVESDSGQWTQRVVIK
jgi:hypothetical protein